MPADFDPAYQVPSWGWWIVLYFFAGGVTGGVSFAAAWLDLFGDANDRAAMRLGHLLAFPLILVCALFLVVAVSAILSRRERLLRMALPWLAAFAATLSVAVFVSLREARGSPSSLRLPPFSTSRPPWRRDRKPRQCKAQLPLRPPPRLRRWPAMP